MIIHAVMTKIQEIHQNLSHNLI